MNIVVLGIQIVVESDGQPSLRARWLNPDSVARLGVCRVPSRYRGRLWPGLGVLSGFGGYRCEEENSGI